MFRRLVVAIAFTATATVATASPVPGTATLAAPNDVARIITETGAWSCTGTDCRGRADSVTGSAVAACTAVADKAGKVAAFTAGTTAFGEAELTRCNRHVK